MNDILSLSVYAWILGIGATIILDLWILIGQLLLNIPAPNWSMVGRWVGHMRQGQFIQQNLNTAPAIKMETALGWLVHYLTGIVYGYLLLLIWGLNWFQQPTILPQSYQQLALAPATLRAYQVGLHCFQKY